MCLPASVVAAYIRHPYTTRGCVTNVLLTCHLLVYNVFLMCYYCLSQFRLPPWLHILGYEPAICSDLDPKGPDKPVLVCTSVHQGSHRIAAPAHRLKKQEARKEVKALKAAQIEKSLEKELLSRLNQGTYGDIYNFPSMQYNRVLDKAAMPDGEEEVDVTGGAKREVAAEANRDDDLELDYNSDEVCLFFLGCVHGVLKCVLECPAAVTRCTVGQGLLRRLSAEAS